MSLVGLLENVTGVSALSGAIDGTAKIAPRLAKARADGSQVATRWQCPYCLRYGISEPDNMRHIAIEAHFMYRALPASVKPEFTRTTESLRIPSIRRVALQSGRMRYRFTIDVGRRANGRRDQRQLTFDTFEQAVDARSNLMRRGADKAEEPGT